MMDMDVLKAIIQRDVAEITRYISEEKHIDISEIRDKFGDSALHFSKDAAISKILLQMGCDPNCQNNDLETPLHTWYKCFKDNVIQSYLETVTNLDNIEVLLEAGALPNTQDFNGYNALHTLFMYGGQFGVGLSSDNLKKFTSLLLTHGTDVNMPDYEGRTPLYYAIKENNVEIVKLLIEAGSDCNHRDLMGLTPLNTLVSSDDYEMIETLLNYGADSSIGDREGRIPLYTASAMGNTDMVRLILDTNSTCINSSDQNNISALHAAAAYKRIDITEELLLHGASTNTKDMLNATPLHYAAYGGTPEIISLLLQSGADPNIQDNSSNIAEDYALHRHFFHTVKAFGKERLTRTLNIPQDSTPETIDEYIIKSLPADDVFNVILPSSKVNKNPFDVSIFPTELLPYMKDVAKGDMIHYLRDLHCVPGIGPIQDTQEIVQIKNVVETFVRNWMEVIANVDNRFKGTLIPSGSVYEGTKTADPCEFDFMVCLDQFKDHFTAQITEATDFNDVTLLRIPHSKNVFSDLCCEDKLESEQVIKRFVVAARRALTAMKYGSGCSQLYVESLTEETYFDDTWINTRTVTCNIRLQWTGPYHKLLTISLDLVPAFAVSSWPDIALSNSPLITDGIKTRGCHVVSKQGKWRLSFSLAEQAIFRNLSSQERQAFTGAKMVINGAVSTRITIYDDSILGADDLNNIVNGEITQTPQQEKNEGPEKKNNFVNEAEFLSLTSEERAGKWFSAEKVAQTESYDGSPLACVRVTDENFWKNLQEEEGTIVDIKYTNDTNYEDDDSNDSDVPTYTFEPRDVIGTYLLKMTFFHVLHEIVQDETKREVVTTAHIFSLLYKCLKDNKQLPYFFVPKHDMLTEKLRDTDSQKMHLAITLMHYLLLSVVKKE